MADRATALERESLVIRGVRSQLTLEGGVITIHKEATTQATPTEVEMATTIIRGATMDVPKIGGRGWLHIATSNGSPAPVGDLAATGDPYTLPITGRNAGASRKLVKMIDKHVRERGLPGDTGPNQGRYSSGVVLSSVEVKTVPAAAAKPAAAKRPAAKKAAAKKATAKPATAKSGDKVMLASELIGQLRELGELHQAGVLDEAEFAAAKAKILG